MEHKVPHRKEWIEARKKLLQKEKDFTKLRDKLTQQRRDLPWEAVSKSYIFDGPNGKVSLADLFNERSQLIVYHFMFSPNSPSNHLDSQDYFYIIYYKGRVY
ncbi:DUF899 family protein [Gottfriedia sp. NPDC057948]|uniref:DUF899 family protein n=1 Tax=Gottfriedia sp. NPDC057948 TaxID=3346287 RepID=UPI0036DD42CB